MFARTFSFWRRLVQRPTADSTAGGSGDSATDTVAQDDRRLWIRYPADLTTCVQPADHPGEDRTTARIRDISRGGANLLLDRSFRPGQMLDLQLPLPEEPDRIVHLLACVVRVKDEPGGHCSVGCVFSRELTDEDLFQFGASRVRHAPEDQRTWVRFPCQLKATFQKVGDGEETAHEAHVINISASGIGLEVPDEIEVGSLLNLHVVGKQDRERTLISCVVHAAPSESGQWNLGCNFIRELNESDIQELM
jgi:PilZ domain